MGNEAASLTSLDGTWVGGAICRARPRGENKICAHQTGVECAMKDPLQGWGTGAKHAAVPDLLALASEVPCHLAHQVRG